MCVSTIGRCMLHNLNCLEHYCYPGSTWSKGASAVHMLIMHVRMSALTCPFTAEMSFFAAWFIVGLYDVIRLFSELGQCVIILSAKSEENGQLDHKERPPSLFPMLDSHLAYCYKA
jgi:hypothetical protein